MGKLINPCPKCHSTDTSVNQAFVEKSGEFSVCRRRRSTCNNCGYRWNSNQNATTGLFDNDGEVRFRTKKPELRLVKPGQDEKMLVLDKGKQSESKFVVDRSTDGTDIQKFVNTKILDRIVGIISNTETVKPNDSVTISNVLDMLKDVSSSIEGTASLNKWKFKNDASFDEFVKLMDGWLYELIYAYFNYVNAYISKGNIKGKLFFQPPYSNLTSFQEALLDHDGKKGVGKMSDEYEDDVDDDLYGVLDDDLYGVLDDYEDEDEFEDEDDYDDWN